MAADTPAVADNTPAAKGANSTSNTTKKTTEESTRSPHGGGSASELSSLSVKDKKALVVGVTPIELDDQGGVVPINSTDSVTPALEGVSNRDDYYEWNGRKILKAGRGDPFGGVALAPVEMEVKTPCPRCNVPMEKELRWNSECV